MQEKYSTNLEVNKVKISFSKKAMTAYGGYSLLSKFFDKIKLKDFIAASIPIEEHSPNSLGIYEKVLSYILTVFSGGNRFDHLPYLGSTGDILEKIFGLKKRIPKAGTTLTRMFRKLKNFRLVDILSHNVWIYLEQLIPWGKIKEDWLDFDSSVIERYGNQEGAKVGYNPKKRGRPSHHPLIAFLSKSRFVIMLWNRSGNTKSNNNAIRFFQESYERIKDKLKIIGIRMDSGFYDLKIIKELEDKGLIYIISAMFYLPIQQKLYSQKNWIKIGEGLEICDFKFKHPRWDKERRYIGIRQEIARRKKAKGKQLSLFEMPGYRYSAFITNSDKRMEEVYRGYNPRGNDENVIKELKYDFALGGFSMKKFYATEAAMILRVLAYNLYNLLRYDVLDQKGKAMEQLKTFKNKYLIIPGLLGGDGKDSVLRLSIKDKKFVQKFIYIFSCIDRYLVPI